MKGERLTGAFLHGHAEEFISIFFGFQCLLFLFVLRVNHGVFFFKITVYAGANLPVGGKCAAVGV